MRLGTAAANLPSTSAPFASLSVIEFCNLRSYLRESDPAALVSRVFCVFLVALNFWSTQKISRQEEEGQA